MSRVVLVGDWPLVTLCFLECAIDLGTLDGRTVFALFAMLSPTARAHLPLSSRTAFARHDPVVRTAVAERAGREARVAKVHRVEAALTSPLREAPSESRD